MVLIFLILLGCNKATKDSFDINRGVRSDLNEKNIKLKKSEYLYKKIIDLSKSKKLSNYYKNGDSIINLIIKSKLNLDDKKKLFFIALKNILMEKHDNLEIKNFNQNDLEKIINNKEGPFFKYIKMLFEEKDFSGRSIIFSVIDHYEEYFLDLIINVVDLEIKDVDGLTPLVYIISSRPNIINELIKKSYISKFKMNYNKKVKSNINDPLIYAVLKGDIELIKLLVSLGCSVNSLDEEENKAILVAADKGKLNVIDLLISLGAKYLNREELIKKKAMFTVRKGIELVSSLAAVVGAGAFVSATGPLAVTASPNINEIRSYTEPSKKALRRHKLYMLIFDRFLEGQWINFDTRDNLSIKRYKDYLLGIESFIYKVDKSSLIEKIINSLKDDNKLKDILNNMTHHKIELEQSVSKAFFNSKNINKRIMDLKDEFNKINKFFLSKKNLDLYEKINQKFLDNDLKKPKTLNSLFYKIESKLKTMNSEKLFDLTIKTEDEIKKFEVLHSYVLKIISYMKKIDFELECLSSQISSLKIN